VNNAIGNRRANDLRPGRPQLAARGGLNQKRAVSTPHIAQRNQALASIASGGEHAPQHIRNQVNVKANGAGISIRGMSSTNYTVIAQNFALGTTAADIEAVLIPDETEAGLVRCRLIASNPTVIAEVVLANKEVADNIIATYNNKKVGSHTSRVDVMLTSLQADGRLLHVYLKDPPPDLRRTRTAPAPVPVPINDDVMDLEEDRAQYAAQRTSQARSPKQFDGPRGTTRAEPDVQDGRWGFSDTQGSNELYHEDDVSQNQYNRRGRGTGRGGGGGGGLVSDGMLNRGNGNSKGYYRR
jgi:hypothetical protein